MPPYLSVAKQQMAAKAEIFNIYAQTAKIVCPVCQGGVEYQHCRPTDDKHVQGVEVAYRCRDCGKTMIHLAEAPRTTD